MRHSASSIGCASRPISVSAAREPPSAPSRDVSWRTACVVGQQARQVRRQRRAAGALAPLREQALGAAAPRPQLQRVVAAGGAPGQHRPATTFGAQHYVDIAFAPVALDAGQRLGRIESAGHFADLDRVAGEFAAGDRDASRVEPRNPGPPLQRPSRVRPRTPKQDRPRRAAQRQHQRDAGGIARPRRPAACLMARSDRPARGRRRRAA